MVGFLSRLPGWSLRRSGRICAASCAWAFVLGVGLASASGGIARAETIEKGDVLEMTVVGTPELNRKATIDSAGQVLLPLFGEVPAAGRHLSELREALRRRLPSKIYSAVGPNGGQEGINSIDPANLLLTIVERMPVYVTGDVSKPGDQPYRVGMTVRQLVALAGGYDVMRLRKTDPFLESADLRSEYVTLWTSFAQQQAAVWRLKAELEGKDDLDGVALKQLPIPQSLAQQIIDGETQQLRISKADFERSQANLTYAIGEVEKEMTALGKQGDLQQTEIAEAASELQSMQASLSKGLISAPRVTDARRALLLQSTLQLQTRVDLLRASTQSTDLQRQRQSAEAQRKLGIVSQLKDARVALASTRAKLEAVGEKIEYTSLIRSQLVRGAAAPPDIVIHRRPGADGKGETVRADEDTQVRPGDVVDIALRLEGDPAKTGAIQ